MLAPTSVGLIRHFLRAYPRRTALAVGLLGLAGLAEAAAAVSIPVIAIAGITPDRVGPCLDAGAWGVAVMTAVTTADDVTAAAAAFREAIERLT